LLCLLDNGLSAQTTLDDYRREVIAYSRILRAAESAGDEARQQMELARTGRLPQLSAAGTVEQAFRRQDGNESWSFDLQPQVIQILYAGGAVRAAIRSAELAYDAALCDAEFTMLEVRYAADYAYWNLAAAKAYAAAQQHYVQTIRALREIARERFDEGYTAKGDLLMTEARLSEAEYILERAEQRREVALHNFNILRGAPPRSEASLATTLSDSIERPARMEMAEILARRPDYEARAIRTEQARVAIRSARAPYNPQLSAGARGVWKTLSPNRSGHTTLDGAVLAQISIPIFHGGARRRAVEAARAAAERSRWAKADLHDSILREEADGWTAVTRSLAQVRSTAASLRIAGENLDLSTYSYNEGLGTILDILQAQLSWIQLYTNAISAKFDYAVAVSDYNRITAR